MKFEDAVDSIDEIGDLKWSNFLKTVAFPGLISKYSDLKSLESFGGNVYVYQLKIDRIIVAAYPFFIRTIGLCKVVENFPLGLYSSVLVSNGVEDELITGFLTRMFNYFKSFQSVRLYADPFDRYIDYAIIRGELPDGFKVVELKCAVVNTGCDYKDVRLRYNRGLKKNLRQCSEKNVKVIEVNSISLLKEAYHIFEYIYKYHSGKMPYPYKFYENLFLSGGCGRFYIAEVDGINVAASVHLVNKEQSFNLLTAGYKEYMPFHGNALLIDFEINQSAQYGRRYYNLGASPLGGGLIAFKKTWGADNRSYHCISHDTYIFKCIRCSKKVLCRILTVIRSCVSFKLIRN